MIVLTVVLIDDDDDDDVLPIITIVENFVNIFIPDLYGCWYLGPRLNDESLP